MSPTDAIRRHELDGVPCYVAERDGPLVVGLVFRVGFADETLAIHGITHLVEHLALFDASQAHHLSINGFVEAELTTFIVRGTPDEVTTFVASVCRSLRQLPAARVETEGRVLETENSRRNPDAYSALLAYRFGATTFGLANYPQMSLACPDARRAQAWARQYFTAGNAALWSSGPLPDDLRLDLPPGERRPPAEPAPLPWALPTWFPERTSIVALSFLVPRSTAVHIALAVLQQRVHDRLRMVEGHSYEVSAHLDTFGPAWVHGMLAADSREESFAAVRDGLVEELGMLASTPMPVDELDGHVQRAERALTDPEAEAPLAQSRAHAELVGAPGRTIAERIADLRAVTPIDVSAAADAVLRSAMLQVPGTIDVTDRRFHPLPGWSDAPAAGTTFGRQQRLPDESGDHQLVVGPTALSYVLDADRRATVAFDDCVAAQWWDDGARTLWSPDGLCVFVHPDEWRDGAGAIAGIDAAVPGTRWVRMGRPAGSAYLEEVARLGAATTGKRSRWFGRRRR